MTADLGFEGSKGIDPGATLGALHQSLGDELRQVLTDRVAGAEVVTTFSTRNGKDVELVQDSEGLFVKRTYHPEAVREIEEAGVDFADAWRGFNAMFEGAGLGLVPSTLIDTNDDADPVIVTEYVGQLVEGNAVRSQPQETKVALLGGLGKLLTSSPDFLPASKGFSSNDAFVLHPQTGELCLLDVDPYMYPRRYPLMGSTFEKGRLEGVSGAFMKKIGFNIREWAQNDDERTAMALAFVRTAGEALEDDSSMVLIEQFSYVHFMSSGLDPDLLGLK